MVVFTCEYCKKEFVLRIDANGRAFIFYPGDDEIADPQLKEVNRKIYLNHETNQSARIVNENQPCPWCAKKLYDKQKQNEHEREK